MKKKFMTKALAVVLSASMALSVSPAVNMETASAAAKIVRLNTTYKTLKVGQKNYKLKLVNNTLKWKIKKASTTNKKIATVYGKKASYVLLKGKGVGRATIKLSLKTSARKKNNTKTLKCRVNVVPAGSGTQVTDPDKQTPVQTTAVVGTQTELDAALANPVLTEITIRTDSTASFVIPAGTHSSVDLIVDAPNASVTNSGVFKTVTISDMGSNAWTEKAAGNVFRVTASKAHVIIDEGANVSGVSVLKADADVTIETKGTLAGVTVSSKAKVTLTGSSEALIPVAIEAAAAGSEFISSVPVAVDTAADATIELQANAEKSTINISNEKAVVTVKNNTNNYAVPVTRGTSKNTVSKGTQTLRPASSQGGSSSGNGYYGTGSGSWGSGGSSTPSDTRKENAKVAKNDKELEDYLKDSSVTELTILTRNQNGWKNKDAIEIPAKSYNMKLIVDAPDATIHNYGVFTSIQIKDISINSWHEWADGNTFTVSAPKPRIVVEEGARTRSFSFRNPSGKNAIDRVKLEVKGNVLQGITFAGTAKNADVDVVKGAAVSGGVTLNRNASNSNIKLNVSGAVYGNVNGSASSANLIMSVEDKDAYIENVSVYSDMNVMIKAVQNLVNKINVLLNSMNGAAKLTSDAPVNVTVRQDDASVILQDGAKGSELTYGSDVTTVGISTAVDITAKKQGSSETVTIAKGTQGEVTLGGDDGYTEQKVHATGIELSYADLTLVKGDAEEIHILPVPAYAMDKIDNSTWSAATSDIITITESKDDPAIATVTADNVGVTQLNVSSTVNGVVRNAEITVTVMDADAIEDDTVNPVIKLNVETPTIKAGETTEVTASLDESSVGTAADAKITKVEWTVNDETIADIAEKTGSNVPTATVTGNAEGEVIVTAIATVVAGGKTYTDIKGTTSVTVAKADTEPAIKLDKEKGTVAAGENLELIATVTPEGATVTDVTWTSSNPAAATVTGSALTGTVTGVAKGNTKITVSAKVDGKDATASADIEVLAEGETPVEEPTVTLSVGATTVAENGTTDVTASISSEYESVTIVWESSNKSVATVEGKAGNGNELIGTVTGVKAGTATITATATIVISGKTFTVNATTEEITVKALEDVTPTIAVTASVVTGSSVASPEAFIILENDIKSSGLTENKITNAVGSATDGKTTPASITNPGKGYSFTITDKNADSFAISYDLTIDGTIYTVPMTVTISGNSTDGYKATVVPGEVTKKPTTT